jgi:hypothetical protein
VASVRVPSESYRAPVPFLARPLPNAISSVRDGFATKGASRRSSEAGEQKIPRSGNYDAAATEAVAGAVLEEKSCGLPPTQLESSRFQVATCAIAPLKPVVLHAADADRTNLRCQLQSRQYCVARRYRAAVSPWNGSMCSARRRVVIVAAFRRRSPLHRVYPIAHETRPSNRLR